MVAIPRLSRHRGEGPQRKSFLAEALILLTVLMTAIAIFMSLFSSGERMGIESVQLDHAVLLATSEAERFSADPSSVGEPREEDGLVVVARVTPKETSAGTLYQATIVVTREGAELYRLSTARYVSGVI